MAGKLHISAIVLIVFESGTGATTPKAVAMAYMCAIHKTVKKV